MLSKIPVSGSPAEIELGSGGGGEMEARRLSLTPDALTRSLRGSTFQRRGRSN